MPPSSRIPPLLEPYIHLPHDDSLLLLTSTLGASANWLLIRFLCDALNAAPDAGEEGHNVVLVSWMREYEFWKQEARKGTALDLERLRREGRFAFVDGLSGLCLEDAGASSIAQPQRGSLDEGRISSAPVSRTIPVRGPPGRVFPARGPPVPRAPTDAAGTGASTKSSTPGHYTLTSLDLAHLKSTVSSAISTLTTSSSTPRKTFIILDNPDLVLALNPTITPSALTSLTLTIHMLPTVSHILLQLQADNPLLSLSTPPQPLEHTHHNFLVKYAHMSRRILGVRVLDTGVARDVSGVIRVTEHKTGWGDLGVQKEGKGDEDTGKGKEFLYQVKGDGSVRVFERGAGGEG